MNWRESYLHDFGFSPVLVMTPQKDGTTKIAVTMWYLSEKGSILMAQTAVLISSGQRGGHKIYRDQLYDRLTDMVMRDRLIGVMDRHHGTKDFHSTEYRLFRNQYHRLYHEGTKNPLHD